MAISSPHRPFNLDDHFRPETSGLESVGIGIDQQKLTSEEWFTFPNVFMTMPRAIGSVPLGVLMATEYIEPKGALIAAVVLGMTDMEGVVIKGANRVRSMGLITLEKPLDFFKQSNTGMRLDAGADKLFTLSLLSGGIAGGYISPAAFTMLATEIPTSLKSMEAEKAGVAPKVNWQGKTGMAFRVASITSYLSASAFSEHPDMAETLTWGGHGSMFFAVLFGGLSLANISIQYDRKTKRLELGETKVRDL